MTKPKTGKQILRKLKGIDIVKALMQLAIQPRTGYGNFKASSGVALPLIQQLVPAFGTDFSPDLLSDVEAALYWLREGQFGIWNEYAEKINLPPLPYPLRPLPSLGNPAVSEVHLDEWHEYVEFLTRLKARL